MQNRILNRVWLQKFDRLKTQQLVWTTISVNFLKLHIGKLSQIQNSMSKLDLDS